MTKFADMPIGSRNGWILWAQSHDWSTEPSWYDDMTGEMVTYSTDVARDGSWLIVEARHTTPRDMKAWAGY